MLTSIETNRDASFNQIADTCSKDLVFCSNLALAIQADSSVILDRFPDNSVSLILTDPPYHSTKKSNIYADASFREDEHFLDWMSAFFEKWKRILRPNGSIFCFCSAKMASRLEIRMANNFNVLSHIVWTKPNDPGFDGWKQKMKKESLRQWYDHTERILFGEPSFEGNLFKSYFANLLKESRKRAGISAHELTEKIGAYGKVNHGGAVSNWEAGRNTPSREQYQRIREVLRSTNCPQELPEYDDAIRAFNVDSSIEFTDLWSFENVRPYPGKHPAEKPQDLLLHAIRSTTNAGDIVLDCFAGSGSTALAASRLGRRSISIEIESKWSQAIENRLRTVESHHSDKIKSLTVATEQNKHDHIDGLSLFG